MDKKETLNGTYPMKWRIFLMTICALSSTQNHCSKDGSNAQGKKIVIIGAGLAGLTTGYRLHKKGFNVHIYEARNRVGGRILSTFVNGNVAELGGENIADGGEAENIRQLAQELKLELECLEVFFNHAFHHNGMLLSVDELIKKHNFNLDTLQQELYALKGTCASMQEVLDQLFNPDDPLKIYFSSRLAGYEGAPVDQLSSSYVETLHYMIRRRILHAISAAYQNNETLYTHVKDGNSKLPEALAKQLGEKVHLAMPLISITKDKQNQYTLTFKNGFTTTADILVLTMPCPVYNDITFGETVIPADRLTAIRSIHNGKNAKILVPISEESDTSTIFINDQLGIFTFVQKIVTLYFSGPKSMFSPSTINQTYAQAKSLLAAGGFKQKSVSEQTPAYARDESFVSYVGPVGYSWPNDPFAQGTYSYTASGQDALFTTLQEKDGITFKTLFAPIDDTIYFAGEHASTLFEVPGTMEAACQSGNLAANMIEKLGM